MRVNSAASGPFSSRLNACKYLIERYNAVQLVVDDLLAYKAAATAEAKARGMTIPSDESASTTDMALLPGAMHLQQISTRLRFLL
jgi:hypothetical protein